jgi:hypothetical protein
VSSSLIRQSQSLEHHGAENSKPSNARRFFLGMQRGQRREQQGGEEGEGVFHGGKDWLLQQRA